MFWMSKHYPKEISQKIIRTTRDIGKRKINELTCSSEWSLKRCPRGIRTLIRARRDMAL